MTHQLLYTSDDKRHYTHIPGEKPDPLQWFKMKQVWINEAEKGSSRKT